MSTQMREAWASQERLDYASVLTPLSRPVSIVGCGIISPAIISARELVRLLLADEPGEKEIGGHMLSLDRLHAASGLSPREVKRVDRFSLLGLAAARATLHESGLSQDEITSCGIITGNMMAGWTFTEPQLRALHTTGLADISPYLATAWFPAAPQGQVTIHLGMHGFAKTVTTDRCAGAQAIGMAFKHIRGHRSELLLAGGVEAPLTPFVESAFTEVDGAVVALTEAAAYLLLAVGQGKGITIGAHATFSLPGIAGFPDEIWTRQLNALMEEPAVRLPIDIVVCNVPMDHEIEAGVTAIIRDVIRSRKPQMFFPTHVMGDCLAASGAVAAVVAHEMLMQRMSPCSALVLSMGHQCGDLLLMQKLAE